MTRGVKHLPSLTVVVAASDSAAAVARTLFSLGACAGADVIVAAPSGTIPRPAVLPAGVVWLAADPEADVPALRRLGFDHARGDVVAFTEDSCIFNPGWADAWRSAFADPRVVAATGPVVPSMGDRPIDWAVFFCEYAPFLPGLAPTRLAGNNFAVRRSCPPQPCDDGLHESAVLFSPTGRPDSFAYSPLATAAHVRRYTLTEALRDRLRLGLDYGRRRGGTVPRPLRELSLFVGPMILLVQAVRLSVAVARRRRHLGRYLETLQFTLLLLTAWSVGEWLGWTLAAAPPSSRKRRERAARPPSRPTAPPGSTRPRCKVEPPHA